MALDGDDAEVAVTGQSHRAERAPRDREAPRGHERPDLQVLTRELRLTDQQRTAGSVRWFNAEKGYGFIAPDDGGDDVFVRFSSIEADGFRALESGQRVEFARTSDARGPRAVQVEIIGSA